MSNKKDITKTLWFKNFAIRIISGLNKEQLNTLSKIAKHNAEQEKELLNPNAFKTN